MGLKDVFGDVIEKGNEVSRLAYDAVTKDPIDNYKTGVKSMGEAFKAVAEDAVDSHRVGVKEIASTIDNVSKNGASGKMKEDDVEKLASEIDAKPAPKNRYQADEKWGTHGNLSDFATHSSSDGKHVLVTNAAICLKAAEVGTFTSICAKEKGMTVEDATALGNAVAAYSAQYDMYDVKAKGVEFDEATRHLADRISREYGVDSKVIEREYKLASETMAAYNNGAFNPDVDDDAESRMIRRIADVSSMYGMMAADDYSKAAKEWESKNQNGHAPVSMPIDEVGFKLAPSIAQNFTRYAIDDTDPRLGANGMDKFISSAVADAGDTVDLDF